MPDSRIGKKGRWLEVVRQLAYKERNGVTNEFAILN
jgi:hypothetical protein